MEEGNITVDGVTHEVPKPYMVIATQNPAGSSGTQLLPESQLDRFIICLTMGYPDLDSEIEILKRKQGQEPLDSVQPVANADDILAMQEDAAKVFLSDEIYRYIATLVARTRSHPKILWGQAPARPSRSQKWDAPALFFVVGITLFPRTSIMCFLT